MKETQTRMSVLQQTHKKFKGYKILNPYLRKDFADFLSFLSEGERVCGKI
jgi:hypothetical protein